MATSSSTHTSTFKKVQQLESGHTKVNVIGVVTTFRPPCKSRGNDYSCSFDVVDEGGQHVKCVLFNPYQDKLPENCSSGDVICLHRVNVIEFNERLQVQGPKFSSWILFKSSDPGVDPITCSDSYTLTDSEKQRVRQLKRWASQNGLITGPSGSSGTTGSQPRVNHVHQPMNVTPPSASSQNGTVTFHTAPTSALSDSSWSSTAVSSQSVPTKQERVFKPKSTKFFNIQIKKIAELTSDTAAQDGVCGVVKYFKAPSSSKGKDCYTVIGIVDETSPQKSLECVIFNPLRGKLPIVCRVGEIVLIKGLAIRYFNTLLTGTGHEHTLVGVFSDDLATPLPSSIGTWYEMNPSELSRIESLKQWAFDQGHFLLNTRLEEVTTLHYFNTFCRIASLSTFDQLGIQVLTVYDGTSLKLPSKEISSSSSKFHWEVHSDPAACYMYQGLLVDVFVNGCKNVKVGDYVELVNVLSLPLSGNVDPSVQPQIELKVMNHHLYKGTVCILPEDSLRVQEFFNNLPKPYGPFPVWKPLSNAPTTLGTVLHRESKQTATLKQIEDAPTGSVLCCEVEVTGTGSTPVEDFCQLRCSECKMRYAIPKPEDIESQDPSFLMLGDPCIYCNDSEEDTGTLKYMYVFTLHIRDSTGELEVFVSDKEGTTLLPNVPPTNLYADKDSRQKLLDSLYILTGGNDPFFPLPLDPRFNYPRPLFTCCILSYKSQTERRRYSLIDTVL